MPDIKNAIQLLKAGISVPIGDLLIGCTKNGYFVSSETRHYYNTLSRKKAIDELNEIKQIFYRGLETEDELKQIIGDSVIEFHLSTGDGAGICSEINGILNWKLNVE